jgi:type IV secretory pathway TraG/TraD family ATPase VirD4
MITSVEIAFLALFLFIAYWRDEKLIYIVSGMALAIFGLSFFQYSVYFGISIFLVGGFTAIRGFRLKGAK